MLGSCPRDSRVIKGTCQAPWFPAVARIMAFEPHAGSLLSHLCSGVGTAVHAAPVMGYLRSGYHSTAPGPYGGPRRQLNPPSHLCLHSSEPSPCLGQTGTLAGRPRLPASGLPRCPQSAFWLSQNPEVGWDTPQSWRGEPQPHADPSVCGSCLSG